MQYNACYIQSARASMFYNHHSSTHFLHAKNLPAVLAIANMAGTVWHTPPSLIYTPVCMDTDIHTPTSLIYTPVCMDTDIIHRLCTGMDLAWVSSNIIAMVMTLRKH